MCNINIYIYICIKLSFNHKGDDLKWEEQEVSCNIAYIVSLEKWLLNWSCKRPLVFFFFFEP